MPEYAVKTVWTGNSGSGTSTYRSYERSHIIQIKDKIDLFGSSDTKFRGDKSKHNPEELFLASLSACHMLQYLHLCAEAGVVVISYEDNATAKMLETLDGGGYFIEAGLNPAVYVENASMVKAGLELHKHAHKLCFIANSVNFPVRCTPHCQEMNLDQA